MLIKSAGTWEYRFIILIPGRDMEKLLDGYRASLFAKGFYGAYSFPPAAPLAEVSSPFSPDELKKLAGSIRKLTMAHDGKISGIETGTDTGFKKLSFFGFRINLPAAEELSGKTASGKIIRAFFPPILCMALVNSEPDLAKINPLPEKGPAISFRAAALANLAIRPLPAGGTEEASALSFEWEIDPPAWLPPYKKTGAEK